ncbi:MAG: enoyl-CoA hydratase [Desulfobacteraceae bacterium]|nr:MAG: enoyl-CoA hydratase [Desulfobacteraceae bacterium]
MEHKELLFEVIESTAVITLNRPEAMNALNLSVREELYDAIQRVKSDQGIKVLVITGAGDRAFCAGGDITTMKDIRPWEGRERLKRLQRVTLSLVEMEKVVIAVVNGYAVGGGCNLALAADLIIASDRARFSQSFIRIAVISDIGGLYFLPRRVGMGRAKELLFTGRTLPALEAEKIGLVDYVFPHEELMKRSMEIARQIASGPPRVIGMMKTILRQTDRIDLRSLLEMEAQVQDICFQTEDHKEGVKAFLEKREPRFVGR